MSKVCHSCGRKPGFGHSRSHSMVATKRRFNPNLQRVRIDDGGRPRRVYVCARCLKSVKDHVGQPFELFYEIKGREDLETLNDLREILILDHPIRFICREECRGLCLSCGVNLNETRCNCEGIDRSAPFSQLKKLWPSKKENK